MKKKRIDLFTQLDTKEHVVTRIRKIRKIGFIVACVFLVIFCVEWGAYFFFSTKLKENEKKRTRFEAFIIQNKEFDAKIQLFMFKYQALQTYLKNDTHINQYFDLLKSNLDGLGIQDEMHSFSLTKERDVTFSLKFSTYDSAKTFISELESSSFPEFFETLTMSSFSVSSAKDEEYSLEFKGTLKRIKDGN